MMNYCYDMISICFTTNTHKYSLKIYKFFLLVNLIKNLYINMKDY